MIEYLSISNYALIEDIRVDLNPGLTIITGETGAGKSILLGALSLLLGNRADLGAIRDRDRKCIIEGQFAIGNYGLKEVFTRHDLDYDPHTIIRREILPGGKSRSFVNDTPVNLSQLKPLGMRLVDIHSQQETLVLSSEDFQLEVIDALAGNKALLDTYGEAYRQVETLNRDLERLTSAQETALKETDYNQFLLDELKAARLEEVDLPALEEAYETLSNIETIQESLGEAVSRFDAEQVGALEVLKEARTALARVREIRAHYQEFWERLNSCIIELEDLGEGLYDAAQSLEADPKRMEAIAEQLQQIYKLERKHNASGALELLEIQQQLEEKLNAQLDLDADIERKKRELDKWEQEAYELAGRIHTAREKAIPELKQRIEGILSTLGLPNARFEFQLSTGEVLRAQGTDRLELLFTANKGTRPGPLKKVASGGEMSRIMLAVKAVLARYKELPVIVFDEIDTGVSGEIAHKMAGILGDMSRQMQLLSITHLPQVAAKGEHHLKVYKEDVDGLTQTRIRTLDQEERLVEIAGMIGGTQITEATLANARELLN